MAILLERASRARRVRGRIRRAEGGVAMRITEGGRPAPLAAPARARRARSGFALPENGVVAVEETDVAAVEGTGAAAPGEASEASPTQAVPPILLMDIKAPIAAQTANAAAARQGDDVLKALSGVQRALLEGAGGEARQTLARLAQSLPSAADPRLDAVLQAVALRAAVEAARGE